jgi:D-alanyl-D-alanine carboxypeptidase/D-alanyl-D-alanine-endopeptidase (penicillin-binding protein 4)
MKLQLTFPGYIGTGSGTCGNIVASQSLRGHTHGQQRFPSQERSSFHQRIYIPGFLCALLCVLASCSISTRISKQANALVLKDTAVRSGHIGISIYEPATNRYWYNHDATKYFVPASNTKLFSLYAGLKYLGDSLPALRYEVSEGAVLRIQPTGDPSFLHPEYPNQPALKLMKQFSKIVFTNAFFTDNFLGRGWAWDDYKEAYMTQRSNLPMYGNLISFKKNGAEISVIPRSRKFMLSEFTDIQAGFDVQKNWDNNFITITKGTHQALQVPLSPNALDLVEMLQDTLKIEVVPDLDDTTRLKNTLYSQPVDSLFIPMMHRSDNFFAEQTLLMASNEFLGYMNDRKMVDTMLSTSLKDIPQKPKWVDGSGLSRYNLFTPQSFVYILDKLKNEFGLERLKHILPTGGEGTLTAYYKKDVGFIFAKTGTLSNHCALSGFIITKKNKLLIFSVLANNYQTTATPIRKAIEQFLTGIREKY